MPVNQDAQSPPLDAHARYRAKHRDAIRAKTSTAQYKEIARVKRNKRIQSNLAAGLCARCSKVRFNSSGSFCEEHWFARVAKNALGIDSVETGNRLREKLIQQNYRCPYTGELLVPTENCTLDHIYPLSRFPDLKSDINNVEWVSSLTNGSKGNMTPAEFLHFCSTVCTTGDRHLDNPAAVETPVSTSKAASRRKHYRGEVHV